LATSILTAEDGCWTISLVDEMIYEGEDPRPVLRKVLEQVVSGYGETADDPLRGLGIAGFYLLVRSCGCDVVGQSALSTERGDIRDTMIVQGEDAKGRFKARVFNLVEKDG